MNDMLVREKTEKKNIIKISIIASILVLVSSIVIYVTAISPKMYDKYIEMGNKYLLEENYKEAILQFQKAIKIKEKSIEARVGLAKSYIGIDDIDNAVEKLQEAQNIELGNEDLILTIIDILNKINPEATYNMIQKYIDYIGESNISNHIASLFNECNELPIKPVLSPKPGTYMSSIQVNLDVEDIKLGHTYYYTTDGSIPNKKSNKCSKPISIDKNTEIKIVGYNPKGELTKVYTMEYIIDDTSKKELKELIKEASKLLEDAKEGTKTGNYKVGSKKVLSNKINEIEENLKKDTLTYEDINKMKNELSLAMKVFKENKIEDIDIEKQIKNKGWVKGNTILWIKENEISKTDNFHEGYRYKIIEKNISSNSITYKVDGMLNGIGYIYISVNSNGSINVNYNNVASYDDMSGTYSVNKNKIIETANNYQIHFEGKNYGDKTYTIKYYDYFEFKYMGISIQDIDNYYKNNN